MLGKIPQQFCFQAYSRINIPGITDKSVGPVTTEFDMIVLGDRLVFIKLLDAIIEVCPGVVFHHQLPLCHERIKSILKREVIEDAYLTRCY